MQNLNSSEQLGGGRGGQDMQRLFHRLRDLNEVQDESRNQLCPVFLDEESLIKTRRDSQWSNQQMPTQVNILKELEDTTQPTPHQRFNKRSHYDSQTDQQLRESNRRLQEDNRKLFAECVRLRRLAQTGRDHSSSKQYEGIEEIIALRQQLSDLTASNALLTGQLKQAQKQIKETEQQIVLLRRQAGRSEQLGAQLEEAARVNDQLVARIVALQRDLQAVSRNSSKSNQSISINNSTQESRKAEVEKDRLISNMKIVHQSEKLKLKNTIEELRKELARSSHSPSFSSVVGRNK